MNKLLEIIILLRYVFVVFVISMFFSERLFAQRIYVDGARFVSGGKEVFMNGVNTPWDNWNDFGGDFDEDFWDNEFRKIGESGGNSSRIWISCDGEVGINIDSAGYVSGATDLHWSHLDRLFELAHVHKIYIMATMLSFDHTKDSHVNYKRWRKMIASKDHVRSYIDHYLVRFVERYGNNPYLWSIDACNEIEWIEEDSNNAKPGWDRLQYLVASMAVAVHEKSSILFTLGSAAVKWNCDLPKPFEGNYWSDINLQKQVSSPLARLDFYSPHYYGWVVKYFGNFCDERSPGHYGLDDRPCMVGENPATGVFIQTADGSDSLVVSMNEAYIKAYENGWKGLMVWTSNGVDRFGTLKECGPGLQAFNQKYQKLVNPK